MPRFSKTDNYKVRRGPIVEIDTTFDKPGLDGYIAGLAVTWIDTDGASNVKYSEYDASRLAFHEAHVQAAEQGDHQIVIADQPGCTIASVDAKGRRASR